MVTLFFSYWPGSGIMGRWPENYVFMNTESPYSLGPWRWRQYIHAKYHQQCPHTHTHTHTQCNDVRAPPSGCPHSVGPYLNLVRGIIPLAEWITASLDERQTIKMTQNGDGGGGANTSLRRKPLYGPLVQEVARLQNARNLLRMRRHSPPGV
jgi:hypothetical protein